MRGPGGLDALLDGLPESLDVCDVAQALGTSENNVRVWLRTGELPGYKLPRRWLVLRTELRTWLTHARNDDL